MELNTFGAVLRFAISLEMEADRLFAEREGPRAAGPLAGALSEARAAAQRNLRALERVRREQVNEMLLEALTGLDSAHYDLGAGAPAAETDLTLFAGNVEACLERFYREAAARLSVPEVARSFARLADLHARQRETWQDLRMAK